MTASKLGPALRQIHRLFDETSTAGLDDATLLDRFARSGDQSAFRSIVDRHGPMVLATCRATLRDPSMAEDAFQATFLLLARRARSIREPQAIGGWLHRVARRVANRANLDAALRHRREREAGEIRERTYASNHDDIASTLHEEIDRLPERYRMPVVLCHLEGLTHAEAARRLRRGERTLRRHLAEALPRLRTRLVRRGVTLSTLAIVATLDRSARAAVPESWATMAGSPCPRAVALAAGLLSASAGFKLKLASVVAVGLMASACLATSVIALGAQSPTPPEPAKAQVPAGPKPVIGSWVYSGRVLKPDGRPIAGVTLYLDTVDQDEQPAPVVQARSGLDGRFRFVVAKHFGDENDIDSTADVVAVTDGFGVGVSDGDEPDADREITIRLARDDSPIEGRVVDLEGRPVVGATATVISVWLPDSGDMTAWIAAAKLEGQGGYAARSRLLRTMIHTSGGKTLFRPVTTNPDGRFRLVGVGRERLVKFRIDAPAIRPVIVEALTRPMPEFKVPEVAAEMMGTQQTFRGSTFNLVVSPSRPVEGTIRDVDTGRPIAGVRLVDYRLADDPSTNTQMLRATSGKDGRYRLDGLPRGAGNVLMVLPSTTEGEAYLPSWVTVEDSPGLGPIPLDVKLKRGSWAKGKVINKSTGEPVLASVLYRSHLDNPHLDGAGGFRDFDYNAISGLIATDINGSYRVAVLPGRGELRVYVFDEAFPHVYAGIEDRPMVPKNALSAHASAALDVPEGGAPISVDFAADPGRAIEGTLVDPAGRPVVGALAYGLGAVGGWGEPMSTADFTVYAVKPAPGDAPKSGESWTLLFRHPGKRLAGWRDIRWDEPGPMTIRLEAWAEVVGRVVDGSGRPIANAAIAAYALDKHRRGNGLVEHDDRRILTDADGRFRLEGLPPGLAFQLHVSIKDESRWVKLDPVAPGKVLDQGDIKFGESK